MTEQQRRLHLGLAVYPVGWDPIAWRLPEAYPNGLKDPRLAVDLARTAERGLFDHIFIGSSYANAPESHQNIGRWDSFVLAGAVSAATDKLGLLVSTNSSLEHPFFVARQLATLDHFSNGRAGINIVFGIDRVGDPPANVGNHPVPDNDSKYGRAKEFTEALYKLLYSWDKDFIVDNKETGEFVRADAFHPANFHGEHFNIAGALNSPSPLQKRIPNFHVGTSLDSLEYGAAYAQARFSPWHDLEQGKRAYREQKERVAKNGGDPDKFQIIPGIEVYPGATRREALEKFRQVQAFITNTVLPTSLGRVLGVDLSNVRDTEKVFDVVSFDTIVDTPFDSIFEEAFDEQARVATGVNVITRKSETLPFEKQQFSTWLRESVLNVFDANDLTFKDLYEFLRWRSHFPVLVGDGKKIADWLEEQFHERTLDGAQVFPPYHRGPADLFVDLVVPELQRRGIYRTEYEASTFEENLGTA